MSAASLPPPVSAWEALRRHPVLFVGSRWPWLALAWVLSGWAVATLWLAAFLALSVFPAAALLALVSGVWLAAAERWRLSWVDRTPLPAAHRRLHRPGLGRWFGVRFREPATWWELGYALVFALLLAWLDAAVGLLCCVEFALLAAPLLIALTPEVQPDMVAWLGPNGFWVQFGLSGFGLLTLPGMACLVTAYVAGRVALTRWVLGGRPGSLHAEVAELTRSRARLVDAMDAQRRRIERDLHDGAQQQLTGVAMTLGLARLELAGSSGPVPELVNRAYRQSRQALAELRELVHGLHPQVLTDRGLSGALAALADRSPVPVRLAVHLPVRPPPEVESAAWFVAGEALANVAKHSGAALAWVRVGVGSAEDRGEDRGSEHHGPVLTMEIGDDGRGGADPAAGTGLVGLADRVAVLAGRMTLRSPPGGPTVLTVELPCEP